ncbi:HET domain-containing protein [Colletotrichum plurivorum]|uniref:HET domain-containing protein n=1 Tax=Colletotrichum plurivorum TaxID=2175906 RepID=A0A8H6JSC7_9PEZI|nr:HET domain-containing protein [Colletotrichum plurivorum]
MCLIKASSIYNDQESIELVDFMPDLVPHYAILSHTWESNEVVYADIRDHTASSKTAFRKIRYSCVQTIADGLDYVWIDSCCIDKSSSAELSEAINSMYEWYRKSDICYGYLTGVSSTVDTSKTDGEFAGCRWFTRGWTLQELLAPTDMVFFSDDWVKIGEKSTLSRPLSVITGIDEDILTGFKALESASVAKRMSWAAHRNTTRPEDAAYCLMGLFGVNMPMLYGEGGKAFLRLQEEIMKESDDQSLFAWVDLSASTETYHGLLARSPLNFAYSNSIMPYQDWEPRPPYSMSNRGLRIDLPLTHRGENLYAAALDCPAPPDYEDSSFLAIYLKRIPHSKQQFARVRVNQFAKLQDRMGQERGGLQTIFVRQNFNGVADEEAVYPQHIIQLGCGPPRDEYRLADVITAVTADTGRSPVLLSSRRRANRIEAKGKSVAFRTPKGAGQLAGAVTFARPDGSKVLIMLGSADGPKVGIHAQELPHMLPDSDPAQKSQEDEQKLSFDHLKQIFKPLPAGRDIRLQYSKVSVEIETIIADSCKYLMTDILIEPINESWDPSETVDVAVRMYGEHTGRQNRVEAVDAEQGKQKKPSVWRRMIT